MERKNSPTDISYIPEVNNNITYSASEMRGIQIKQPFQSNGQENKIILSNSTAGYQDIKLSFAALNELAADALVIDYSVAAGAETWITTGLLVTSYPLTASFQMFTVDFSSILTVDNNSNFKIRIRFTGSNMSADLGNRVLFNNISVKGKQINLSVSEQENPLEFIIYPNPTSDVLNFVHNYQDVNYTMYAIDGKLIKTGKLENAQINVSDIKTGIYLL